MTQWVLEESLHQGMQGKRQGQLEGGIHQGHLVRTCRCLLLAGHLGKAHSDKARGELRGQKETVRLGKEQGLQVAVLELLQVGTAQGTARELRGRRGTAPELLVQVDIVQVSHDQGGTHQVLKELLGTALVLQDRRGTGTALAPPGLTTLRRIQSERRAGWVLRGPNRAIPGLQQVEDCWPGQTG